MACIIGNAGCHILVLDRSLLDFDIGQHDSSPVRHFCRGHCNICCDPAKMEQGRGKNMSLAGSGTYYYYDNASLEMLA